MVLFFQFLVVFCKVEFITQISAVPFLTLVTSKLLRKVPQESESKCSLGELIKWLIFEQLLCSKSYKIIGGKALECIEEMYLSL